MRGLWYWYSRRWLAEGSPVPRWLGFAVSDVRYDRRLFALVPFNLLIAVSVWLWERIRWKWSDRLGRSRISHVAYRRGFERGEFYAHKKFAHRLFNEGFFHHINGLDFTKWEE